MNKFTDNRKKRKEARVSMRNTVMTDNSPPLLGIDIWKVVNQKNYYSSPPNSQDRMTSIPCLWFLPL